MIGRVWAVIGLALVAVALYGIYIREVLRSGRDAKARDETPPA